MASPMAAWRVTYTPGEWLVLSGPSMLVVMLPAPPRKSELVNTLWDDIRGTASVAALLKVIGEYGLDQMADFAAFFWDAEGLHGMARGQLVVTDADTGEVVVSGHDVVTWREESLGRARRLRVDMSSVHDDDCLQLPLMVGAVMASAIHLSTDPESSVLFPVRSGDNDFAEAAPQDVGLGDETEMEPFSEASILDDDIPFWTPPVDGDDGGGDANTEGDGIGGLRFDLAQDDEPTAAEDVFRDDEAGTVISDDLVASHKPAASPATPPQVQAVPCARGHANAPRSRLCRICSAPVDATAPRLIDRPTLASVQSNHGDVVEVLEAVVVGRSPDASRGPNGSGVLRVPSPSSDISRSHLIVAAREWSIVVTDLNSTNGTTVLPLSEQSFMLANGESVTVDLGTVLDLGNGVLLRIEAPRE